MTNSRSLAIKQLLRRNAGGQVYTRSGVVEVVDTISQRLKGEKLQEFRDSCFGKFMDIPKIKFQGKLMYIFLAHMCDDPPNALSFRIHNVEAVFGPEEYFVMTGLRFGPPNALPSSSTFHIEQFKGESTIYVGNLRQRFIDECVLNGGETELALKLALLWFVYDVLFGRDHACNKPIDLSYLHAIDDLKFFNSYPWGLDSYTYLVDSAHQTHSKLMSRINVVGPLSSHDLYGFAHVIPFWIYETFPSIGQVCSVPVPNGENLMPRMLRRCTAYQKTFKELKKFFEAGNKSLEYEKLFPCDSEGGLVESERQYFPLIDPCTCPVIPAAYVKSGDFEKKKMKLDDGGCSYNPIPTVCEHNSFPDVFINRQASTDDVNEAATDPLDNRMCVDSQEKLLVESRAIRGYLKQVVELLGELVKVGMAKAPGISQNPVSAVKKEDVEYKTLIDGVESPLKGPLVDDVPVRRSARRRNIAPRNGKGSVEDLQESEGTDCFTPPKSQTVKRKRVSRSKSETSSPEVFIHSSSVFSEAPLKESIHLDIPNFNPLETYDPVWVKRFSDWYSDALSGRNKGYLNVPLLYSSQIERNWFSNVMNHTAWLSNANIDVLLNLLMYHASWRPHLFTSNWSILECSLSPVLQEARPFDQGTKVDQYLYGRLPRQRPLPWKDVERLYGVLNIDNAHWVAYEIQLLEERIVVYDSMYRTSKWGSLKKLFANMSEYIPWLCWEHGILVDRVRGGRRSHAWDVVPCESSPVQPTGSDCGVMCLKVIEFLAAGIPLEKCLVDAQLCGQLRDAYCVKLYKLARNTPKFG